MFLFDYTDYLSDVGIQVQLNAIDIAMEPILSELRQVELTSK